MSDQVEGIPPKEPDMGTLNAPRKTKTLAPEGAHPAMLYSIIDLGTKMDSFQGATPEPKHTIYLSFELLDTQMDDGRPFSISKEYTVTPSKFEEGSFYFSSTSNLNKLLQKWTGKDEKACSKPWVLVDLLNNCTPCTLTVEHVESRKEKGKFYDVIDSVKPYKGKDTLMAYNARLLHDIEEPTDHLAPWIQDRIAECLEHNGGVPARSKTPRRTDEEREEEELGFR